MLEMLYDNLLNTIGNNYNYLKDYLYYMFNQHCLVFILVYLISKYVVINTHMLDKIKFVLKHDFQQNLY